MCQWGQTPLAQHRHKGDKDDFKRIKITSDFENIITNCYIIEDEKTKETMVIDPGGEPERILELLQILGAKVKYIYLTHCHGDHMGALEDIKNKVGEKLKWYL